jgi:hypothetical protein
MRSKQPDKLFDCEPRLFDDALKRPFGKGLVTMNRNANGPDRRTLMQHNVMAALHPIQFEACSLKGRDDLTPGEGRKPSSRHDQAAIVR